MNKKIILLSIAIIYFIYLSIYDGSDLLFSTWKDAFKASIKIFFIPTIFSIFFLFLSKKKYVYVAINSYIIFILTFFAHILNFGSISFRNSMIYAILNISIAFLFIFIHQTLKTKFNKILIASIVNSLIALLLYIFPLIFIIYNLNFDIPMMELDIFAIYDSNVSETYEYLFDFVQIKYILFFIFIISIISVIFYQQQKQQTLFIKKPLLIAVVILFVFGGLISHLSRNHFDLYRFIGTSLDVYAKELALFKEVQEKRKFNNIKVNASKKIQNETYIIVIGESLNKKHMGIYGYHRNTTPILSDIYRVQEGGLIIFNNIYSNHTHTVPVMKKALTESNQYNAKKYYNSVSIIEILKGANIETYWLTNQAIYGAWDNLISVIGTSADHLISLNHSIGNTKTQKLDGALIEKLKGILKQKIDKNRVIFVHLMGNHGGYESRYPKPEYNIFKGKLKQGEFGKAASTVDSINYYDNSVRYNDFVVSSMLKEFQKETNTGGFVYMSDHADDVIAKLGHNSSKFTYEMTQIPMIAWFNDGYKKTYPQKYNNLNNRKNLLFSNDMLYDTMIGIFDIQTDKYNEKYDLTSNQYKLNPKEALVLNGKKKYTDKSNYIFWQKENAKYLIKTKQSSRIFPHRINSIGKLKDIWNNGFRSFEIDVLFDDNSQMFQMGHNHGVMGVGLKEFLNSVNSSDIDRIWLDFKNLNKNNYQAALLRLNNLNKTLNLKDKLIVESSTKKIFFKVFKKDNWHTSYYLPTGEIVKLLKHKDVKKMESLSLKISKQVKQQHLSAVSFDNRLYPFVKQYLEPKITTKIVYHIRYSLKLYDANFKSKLLQNKLYLDKRVKTLIGSYKSQFNL